MRNSYCILIKSLFVFAYIFLNAFFSICRSHLTRGICPDPGTRRRPPGHEYSPYEFYGFTILAPPSVTVRRRQRNGDRTLLLINNLIDNVEVNEQAKRLIIIIILGTVTTTVQTTARLILATNFASTILKRTKVTGDRQRIWLQKKLKEKIQKENKRKKKHTHKQNKIINKEQKDTIYKKSILIDFLC